MKAISPEITRTKRGSATALAESPKNPDVVWVGSDDGALFVTRDGGKAWADVLPGLLAAGLPGPRHVATVEASRYAEGRCYVALDGHRSDDDAAHVFVTEDYGQTWKSLRGNLPAGPTRVVREDIVVENLLYAGTEFGAFASINRGGSWNRLNGATLPTVAVHEFAQPTTANDLVAGTHGRSVWALDVTALRQMTPDVVRGKATLFVPSPVVRWQREPDRGYPFSSADRRFTGQNPVSGATIDYVLGKKAEKASLRISDAAGHAISELSASTEPGFHRVTWDLGSVRTGRPARPGPAKGPNPKDPVPEAIAESEFALNPLARTRFGRGVPPGTYRVTLTVDGVEAAQPLAVEADPAAPPEAATAIDEVEEAEREQNRERPVRVRADN